MKSTLRIRWTEEASKNLESIAKYLESNWSEKELKSFFLKLEKQLEIVLSAIHFQREIKKAKTS